MFSRVELKHESLLVINPSRTDTWDECAAAWIWTLDALFPRQASFHINCRASWNTRTHATFSPLQHLVRGFILSSNDQGKLKNLGLIVVFLFEFFGENRNSGLIELFAVLEPQKPSIAEFYAVLKLRSTDFEALLPWNARSGVAALSVILYVACCYSNLRVMQPPIYLNSRINAVPTKQFE